MPRGKIIFSLILTFILAGCTGPALNPGEPVMPTPAPSEYGGRISYCLTKEEYERLKAGPVDLTCDRTDIGRSQPPLEKDVQWTKVVSNATVSHIFIHAEKQLILKEVCDGDNYYTWKCHPPEWGSMYANTMWKLIGDKDGNNDGPNRTPLKNGDRFDIYLRKDAEYPTFMEYFCRNNPYLGKSAAESPPADKAAEYFKSLAANPLEGQFIKAGGLEGMWAFHAKTRSLDLQPKPPRKLLASLSLFGNDYDAYQNPLVAFGTDEDKMFYLFEAGKLETLKPNEEIEYDAFTILKKTVAGGSTLKEGTFKIDVPTNRWFDIYLPESKPVVYLYPEKPLTLDFKIKVFDGRVTVSDPFYPPTTGWQNITALPNGVINYQNSTYPYLYYETENRGAYNPIDYGLVLEKEQAADYLSKEIVQRGLNGREANDFLFYWLARINNEVTTPFLQIAFIPQEEIARADSLVVSTAPETEIRLRTYFKPLNSPIFLKPQPETGAPRRSGFTLVEWGGIMDQ